MRRLNTVWTPKPIKPLGPGTAKYVLAFVNEMEITHRVPSVVEVCKLVGISQSVGTNHEHKLKRHEVLTGKRDRGNFGPNPYFVFTKDQATFLVLMSHEQEWTQKRLLEASANCFADRNKANLIFGTDESSFYAVLADFLSPWSGVVSAEKIMGDQIRFVRVEGNILRVEPFLWHQYHSIVLGFASHGRPSYNRILERLVGPIFSKIVEDQKGNGKVNFLSLLWSGRCPWCGSTWNHGRDIKSQDRRQCIACDVTFEIICPNCRAFGRSLGFSSVHGEYGCDRCGGRWSPEEFAALFIE